MSFTKVGFRKFVRPAKPGKKRFSIPPICIREKPASTVVPTKRTNPSAPATSVPEFTSMLVAVTSRRPPLLAKAVPAVLVWSPMLASGSPLMAISPRFTKLADGERRPVVELRKSKRNPGLPTIVAPKRLAKFTKSSGWNMAEPVKVSIRPALTADVALIWGLKTSPSLR